MGWEKDVAKPPCHHIWLQQEKLLGTGRDKGKMKLVHRCPKCGYVKTTVRRLLP